MSKLIKQINIFGEIDYINEDGSKNDCEICKKSMKKKANVCSTKCAKIWVDKYLKIEK
jgi:hypothetical protein